jgi:hypothetical protein
LQSRNIVLSKEPSAEERAAAIEAKAARKAANEADDREEQLRAAAEAAGLDEEEGNGEGAMSEAGSAAAMLVLKKQKSVAGKCIVCGCSKSWFLTCMRHFLQCHVLSAAAHLQQPFLWCSAVFIATPL